MEVGVWCNSLPSSLTSPSSLVRWIAYWTAGFEVTTIWYSRRIRKNLSRVVHACGAILPANRASVYKNLQCKIFQPIDGVLAGLHVTSEWDRIQDMSEHEVFSNFRNYTLDKEHKLKAILRHLSYSIKDNSLQMLTRDKPEEVRLSRCPSLQYIVLIRPASIGCPCSACC